jgi:hypothetical protein
MITQKQLLDSHFDRRMANLVHTSFPAEIVAIHNASVIDVQPLVETLDPDGLRIPYPTLYNVRLYNMSNSNGDVFISVPVEIGSRVWVFVSERDTANLMSFNRVESTTTMTHDLSDCFAIPTFFTDTNIPDIPTDKLLIKNKDSSVLVGAEGIEITTDSIKITSKSADIVSETINVKGNIKQTGNLDVIGIITQNTRPVVTS